MPNGVYLRRSSSPNHRGVAGEKWCDRRVHRAVVMIRAMGRGVRVPLDARRHMKKIGHWEEEVTAANAGCRANL